MIHSVCRTVASTVEGIMMVEGGRLLAHRSHHLVYVVNVVYGDGRRTGLVVRLPTRDDPWRRAAQQAEHLILSFLEDQGFSYAPRSVAYDTSLEWFPVPYSIQSYVPSTPLRQFSSKQSLQMAIETAELHDIDYTLLLNTQVPCCVLLRHCLDNKLRALLAYIRRSVDRPLSAAPIPKEILRKLEASWEMVRDEGQAMLSSSWDNDDTATLIHGDLGSHNAEQTNDGLFLYDWEMAAVADPAYDLARLFRADFRQASEQGEFLQQYWSHRRSRSDEDGFMRRLHVYERIAALENAIWALRMVSKKETRAEPVENVGMGLTHRELLDREVFANLQFIGPRVSRKSRRELQCPRPQ